MRRFENMKSRLFTQTHHGTSMPSEGDYIIKAGAGPCKDAGGITTDATGGSGDQNCLAIEGLHGVTSPSAGAKRCRSACRGWFV
jgi:hypothetical protein